MAISLHIPSPCNQAWDQMTTTADGRFCQHCQKQVLDFSGMSDTQVLAHIKQGHCGRFQPGQLDRPLAEPAHSFLPAAMLASLIAAVMPSFAHAQKPTVIQRVDTFDLKPLQAPVTIDQHAKPPEIDSTQLYALAGKVGGYMIHQTLWQRIKYTISRIF